MCLQWVCWCGAALAPTFSLELELTGTSCKWMGQEATYPKPQGAAPRTRQLSCQLVGKLVNRPLNNPRRIGTSVSPFSSSSELSEYHFQDAVFFEHGHLCLRRCCFRRQHRWESVAGRAG